MFPPLKFTTWPKQIVGQAPRRLGEVRTDKVAGGFLAVYTTAKVDRTRPRDVRW
jgi:hypothetical protein